jgi:hypothetical protein
VGGHRTFFRDSLLNGHRGLGEIGEITLGCSLIPGGPHFDPNRSYNPLYCVLD